MHIARILKNQNIINVEDEECIRNANQAATPRFIDREKAFLDEVALIELCRSNNYNFRGKAVSMFPVSE